VTVPGALSAKLGGVTEAFVLPTQYTTLTLDGTRPVSFQVNLAVLDTLHYDGAVGKFLARLAIMLLNVTNTGDSSALAQELPVLIAANGADISPNEPKFSALHVPVEIHLAVSSPVDPYSVGVMTALTTMLDSINVPIRRPDIEVRPRSPAIRGLGLEETPVVIRIAEAKGRNGEIVVLQTTRGLIEESVALDASGMAVAHLQSVGIGKAVITASDLPFHERMESVQFTWPIAFALFTILGGIVGAVLRKGAKRNKSRNILIGVLAAVVVGVAHTVGINYGLWGTPAGRAGEGLFFVIAAIAGFLGRQAMELLVKGAKGA